MCATHSAVNVISAGVLAFDAVSMALLGAASLDPYEDWPATPRMTTAVEYLQIIALCCESWSRLKEAMFIRQVLTDY